MRLFWINNSAVIKLLQLFLYCSLDFSTKNFESLFNTVLVQDSLISDDVGCCSGLNKGCGIIYDVDKGLRNIVEGMVSNKQVVLDHGFPIGSSIIVVDGGRVT